MQIDDGTSKLPLYFRLITFSRIDASKEARLSITANIFDLDRNVYAIRMCVEGGGGGSLLFAKKG